MVSGISELVEEQAWFCLPVGTALSRPRPWGRRRETHPPAAASIARHGDPALRSHQSPVTSHQGTHSPVGTALSRPPYPAPTRQQATGNRQQTNLPCQGEGDRPQGRWRGRLRPQSASVGACEATGNRHQTSGIRQLSPACRGGSRPAEGRSRGWSPSVDADEAAKSIPPPNRGRDAFCLESYSSGSSTSA